MILSEGQSDIIRKLLDIEHEAIAEQLGFINQINNEIDEVLLFKSIGLLDELSRINEERARKIIITCSAILWTYKDESWDGLKDFLILILSRVGFPPSAIMIDETFDHVTSKFSGSSSLMNEFNITIHQLNHEVFVGDKKFLVTGFQKKVWDKLSELKLVGISAPTSAGKSFIILLKAIDSIIRREGNIIYIVPTLSLVAQVSADFNRQLKHFQLDNFRIATTYNSQETAGNKIYVLTQEKAISAFSQAARPYENVRVLIVDEIQNIEKVANEDDQRAKTLYDTLMEFRHTCEPDLTIISGPRVEGLKQLGLDIFDQQDADEEKTKDSPVASITYAISKKRGKYFFNQYTDLLKQPNSLPIQNNSFIAGYGRAQYQESFLSYLSSFITSLGPEARNLIFSPTTAQARKTALQLAELREPLQQSADVDSLVSFIKETVHEQYDMIMSIPRGFVYHHGKTPSHIRAVVEHAIKNKLIPNVVCTTTLMQGVNLPAQNVILRNPDLAIRSKNGTKPKLTDYEIANLRGRAGRLLKDFIGRTYVLEEDSFERDDNQLELFPEAEKQLRSGYGEKYDAHRREINRGLDENVPITPENREYAFLITYIRQTLLKHGENSISRLNSVGINLNDSQFITLFESLSQLEVPPDICFKNRYWDPIDLNELFKKRNLFELPSSITEQNIENSLQLILLALNEEFPMYYEKYFNLNVSLIQSASISAKDWMKERTLKQILSSSYFDSPEKVEERISLLQRNISFGLPMLLKPLYDIKAPNSMFLRFIEMGAYKPITRKMIELNIPRETAIYLNNEYFRGVNYSDENTEQVVIDRLRQVKDSIDYWRRIQIEGIG